MSEDIEEYDENDNNSGIIEELGLDTSASNEFVIQFKRCIKTATENPNILLSHNNQSNLCRPVSVPEMDIHHDAEGKRDSDEDKDDEKEKDLENNFNDEEYKEIVTNIIKYATDLDLVFFDDNAQNVLQLMSKLTPNVCPQRFRAFQFKIRSIFNHFLICD